MIITSPKLPPKKGYVEVEINGQRTYCNINTGLLIENENVILTAAEKREEIYNTEHIISWDSKMITVTEAAQLWQYYAAEGSEKAAELQTFIMEAKAHIREKHPDA